MAVDPQKVKEVRSLLAPYDIRTNSRLAALFPPGLYPHTRRCASLVPLFVHALDGQLHVLLTKKASALRSHASTVALPGGVQDASDEDDTHTALREAEEEIGLDPSDVTVIAHLPPLFVGKCDSVYPVVGFIPSDFIYRAKPNPTEVEFVFSVPLRRFVEDDVTYATHTMYGITFQTPFLMHIVTTTRIKNDAQDVRDDVGEVENDVGGVIINDRRARNNVLGGGTTGIQEVENGTRGDKNERIKEMKNDTREVKNYGQAVSSGGGKVKSNIKEVLSYFDKLAKNYVHKTKRDTRNVKNDVTKGKGDVQNVIVEESTPVLVWGATANFCVGIAMAILEPRKQMIILVKDEDGPSSKDEEAEDDNNVFSDTVTAFHIFCKATVPSSRL